MRPAPSPGFIYRLLSCILYPFWLAHSIRHGSKHSLPQYRRMRGAAGAERRDDLDRLLGVVCQRNLADRGGSKRHRGAERGMSQCPDNTHDFLPQCRPRDGDR